MKNKVKVFIDGSHGTTGLRIYERLSQREDIEILSIDENLRKDAAHKKIILNQADVCFLCLPDDAARESVSLIDNKDTIVIDASTAHRTLPDWTYGLPELSQKQRELIKSSKRIAVPGCHASGFTMLVYPLIVNEIIGRDYPLSCSSLTGYSGGGKAMIEQYQNPNRDASLAVPRIYALSQTHKHLAEMQHVSNLSTPPCFNPVVLDIYSMMCVTVNIHNKDIDKNSLLNIFQQHYSNASLIEILDDSDVQSGFLASDIMQKKDSVKIYVTGSNGRYSLSCLYDNLGKGASGAAVQCLNIVMGCDETKGLEL